jgi:hypothetical protein
MLTVDLHYAGALLNPYLLGEACPHDDVDANEALNKVLQKTVSTPTTYALALSDFANFVKSQGSFFDTPLMKDLDLLPHKWRDFIRAHGCTLAPITHCILVQLCFASSCEWNWNSYLFSVSKFVID